MIIIHNECHQLGKIYSGRRTNGLGPYFELFELSSEMTRPFYTATVPYYNSIDAAMIKLVLGTQCIL